MQGFESTDGELPLHEVLKVLAVKHDVSTVLVEAGRGLMTQMFRQRLANEAWVFTAPFDAGEQSAMDFAPDFESTGAIERATLRRWSVQHRQRDVIARYLIDPQA